MMKNIFGIGAGNVSATGDAKKSTAPTTRKEDVFVSSEEASDTSAGNTTVADSRKENCPSTASDGTAANGSVVTSSEQLSPSTARTTATESPSLPCNNAEKTQSTAPTAESGVAASNVDLASAAQEVSSTDKTNIAQAPEGTDAATGPTEEASSNTEKLTPEKSSTDEAAPVSGTTASDGGAKKTKTSAPASKRGSKEEKKRKVTRTRDDIEAENKKLRSDLTNMRRNLNATQQQLSSVMSTIAKISSVEGVSKEVYDACKATESKLAFHGEGMDTKWQTTAGDGGRRPGRQRQWGQWQQRQQPHTGQDPDISGMTPFEIALHYNSATMHPQVGTSQIPMGQQQSPAPAAGAPRRAGGRRRLRREQLAAVSGSQNDAQGVATRRKDTANDVKIAAQASLAQNIRNELRMAETSAELSKAIEKANKNGMTYEASLGKKKLNKIKQGSATTKPKSKGGKTATTESPAESTTTSSPTTGDVPVCPDQRGATSTCDAPAPVTAPTAA